MAALFDIHMKTFIWQIFNIVLIVGLLGLLQWWLSRRKSPVPGLILPVLHVILSVIMLLSFATYSVHDFVSVTTLTTSCGGAIMAEDASGNVLALSSYPDEVPSTSDDPPADESSADIIVSEDDPVTPYAQTESTLPTVFGLFLLFNIPTYIYLIIYGIERRKMRRSRTVNKTLIQDL